MLVTNSASVTEEAGMLGGVGNAGSTSLRIGLEGDSGLLLNALLSRSMRKYSGLMKEDSYVGIGGVRCGEEFRSGDELRNGRLHVGHSEKLVLASAGAAPRKISCWVSGSRITIASL